MQSRISEFWSTISSGYEAHGGNVAAPGSAEYGAWVEAVESALPAPPANVLDVGTGTGFLSILIASLGHRVSAIDLADGMIDQVRENARLRGVPLSITKGDAVAPPFPEHSFDAVTSRHLLWTLREPETAFRNWRRLLRPGGRVVAFDALWFPEEPQTEEPDSKQEAPGLFDRHYTRETRAALPVMGFRSTEPLAELFRAAGFARVTISDLTAVHAASVQPGDTIPYRLIATLD